LQRDRGSKNDRGTQKPEIQAQLRSEQRYFHICNLFFKFLEYKIVISSLQRKFHRDQVSKPTFRVYISEEGFENSKKYYQQSQELSRLKFSQR
jgi:hypothetical protein